MLENSKDILYLVISFCILWLTVFLCWMLYYLMRILRNANQIVEEFRVKLQVLTDTINYVRGKVEHISGLMTLLTEGVAGFVKKTVVNRASAWLEDKEENFNDAAKAAVGKAVESAAKKMKKAAKRI